MVDGPSSGPKNMARDERLWEAAESGIAGARIYTWEGPWVTLGRFQSPKRALAPGTDVPWINRPTGGRAVLHGHDVTVGLAVPLAALGVPPGRERSLKCVYRAVTGPLLEALRACGLSAQMAEDVDRRRLETGSADCFASAYGLDIVGSDGQKVCGCALRIGPTACLLQASVPARPPLVDPATVFLQPALPHWTSLRPDDLASTLERALGPMWPPGGNDQSISVL